MSTDVLADVLATIRLTGTIHFDFELSAPWVAEAPPSHDIAGLVMPGAQRVIEYHLMARGGCWAHALDAPPIRLEEGDLILFPQGDRHVLASAPGMRSTPDMAIFARRSTPLPIVYELGGGGSERSRILCGFFGCDDRPFNPLLASLPPMIVVSTGRGGGPASWLSTLLHLAVRETQTPRPGGGNVLARLSELIFVEAIRRHLESLPASQTGWLAGLRDPIVGQALAALHGRSSDEWTVERLAQTVGVSRSVLAERFTEIIGHPPMHYLMLWRMQRASRLLADGGAVASTAAAVGYESEAAFSRAFKKIVGEAPGAWRRRTASALVPASA